MKMMRAYRVDTEVTHDYYGYPNGRNAEYFFNREDAERRYADGAYTTIVTRITTTHADGSVSVATTGRDFYNREVARAEANTVVELVEEARNYFTLTEIEIN
jgi:hypothetical protein